MLLLHICLYLACSRISKNIDSKTLFKPSVNRISQTIQDQPVQGWFSSPLVAPASQSVKKQSDFMRHKWAYLTRYCIIYLFPLSFLVFVWVSIYVSFESFLLL
jgi:hypothetical protein